VKLAVSAAKTAKNSGFVRGKRRTQSDRSSPIGTVENRVCFVFLLYFAMTLLPSADAAAEIPQRILQSWVVLWPG